MRRMLMAMMVAMLAFVASGPKAAADDPYGFRFQSIDGGDIRFAAFRGRPVLVVNTASHCGFTHQLGALQGLWERYRDQGLVVLGVPSDDFNQEFATAADVKEFCEVNFAIDFPMTNIEKVRGADAHPFFLWVGEEAGQPRWNFYKYLIGPDGALIDSYSSVSGPNSRKLTGAIEAALEDARVRSRWRPDGATN